jgi:hypothetical protein
MIRKYFQQEKARGREWRLEMLKCGQGGNRMREERRLSTTLIQRVIEDALKLHLPLFIPSTQPLHHIFHQL